MRKPSYWHSYRPLLWALEDRITPGLIAPLSFDAGPNASSLVMGDFNGDGIPDLAVASHSNDPPDYQASVSVLLGNGDGTFQPARTFAAEQDSQSVAIGDFNGDGIPDLAVSSYGFGVDILLGNGDGTFQPARKVAARGGAEVAVGDFNGDGIQDLALTTNIGPNGAVSVLLGNGDGSFQPPSQTFAAGANPRSVVGGDFNGDGHPDLVVANLGSSTVSVLLGNGDGSFQPARTFTVGTYPLSVAVGDFNGDGIPDLAVADDVGRFATGVGVDVLLGNGDGSFQPAVNYTYGLPSPAVVAVGDFNGDGVQDLAVANRPASASTPPTVTVLLGTGDGTFRAGADYYPTGIDPNSMVVGDFNGDGVQDLAVANYDSTSLADPFGSVSVLLGNGDGSFQAAPTLAVGLGPSSVVIGDFNGDGILDLAFTNELRNTVSVLLGNGDGSFQPARTFLAGDQPASMAVGDFNGDGILDLAVTNYGPNGGAVSVLLGNGDGTFQAAGNYAIEEVPASVVAGDFNGDGILDLAVTSHRDSSGVPGRVSVLLGNGDGSFQPAVSYAAGIQPTTLAVGDFNGDGVPDLAVVDYGDVQGNGAGVSVLLGNSDGSFQAPYTLAVGIRPQSVVVGDFNGDGIPDLAITDFGDIDHLAGSVSVLLGNGDGTFQDARDFVVGGDPTSMVVGDFNGDGIPDLAIPGAGGVKVLLGNGDGTFQISPLSYIAGAGPNFLAVGDFNGDGFPDLAVANLNSNNASILLNDGNWPQNPGAAPHRHAPTRRATPHRQVTFASAFIAAEGSPHRTTFLTAFVPAENQPKPKPVAQEIGTDPSAPRPAPAIPAPLVAVRHAEDAAFEGWDHSLLEVPALPLT